ncbi:hypothetical protein ATK74_2757 [Propionicimonas paludicola]|uniref:Lipoprotein antigen n=1 Tax=Propionicimonas paludicola TaxID=185243 RepID=A0A2A9CVY2_9ACTN|nr:hypothetical protein [Propionicimonas paludicola]PFG18175.1 hypothetical protein ATK74_2757 [Propionicimonas paludicola]
MFRKFIGVAALIAATIMMTACTSAGAPARSTTVPATSPSAEASSAGNSQLRPPVFVEPDKLAGQTISVRQDSAVVITSESTGDELGKWTGSTEDATVAVFSPGGTRDGASFNPGFDAKKVGTTKATLTDPAGKSVSFTIQVQPANS